MCIIRYVFEEIAIAAWLLALWNKEAAAAAAAAQEPIVGIPVLISVSRFKIFSAPRHF